MQQTYQALVLNMQGIIESHLHLPQSAPTTMVPLQQTTSSGFFSNLRVKRRRTLPPPAAPVISQHSDGQYSSNYYPGGYTSPNSYNNYQQQQQQLPQCQQLQYWRQQPAHSTCDYSPWGECDAYGRITQGIYHPHSC